MKRILFITLSLLYVMTAMAQDKKVAMLETIADSKETSTIVLKMIRGELTKSISLESGFTAFSRTDIDQMMKELNFQQSGMVSDKELTELGKMSGADYVCISKVSQEGDAYYIEASLIHIESGRIENPATTFIEGGGLSAVNLACQKIARELVVFKPNGNGNTTPANTGVPVSSGYVVVQLNFVDFMVLPEDLPINSWNQAQVACSALTAFGYNDWRLPTKTEALALYNKKEVVGKFAPNWYWTSAEKSRKKAWLQSFKRGFQTEYDKDAVRNVRCLRKK